MNKPTNTQIGWGIVAVAAILATLFFGVNYPVPPAPEPGLGSLDGIEMLEDGSRSLSRPVQLRDVRILQNLDVDGDATVGDDLTVTGDVAAGSLGVGAGYALENPAAGRIIEFGVTGAISTTAVTPVAISTVTAYGCTVNSPSAAAQLCYSVHSGGIITFTIYNAAATPAAISTPHAAGASYWIGGSD